MIEKNTKLEQFLLWFSRLEEVPLSTRRDFFAHVIEVDGLDSKAQKFIDETLVLLEQRDAKKLLVLKQKINLLDAALYIQEKPKFSLKEKIFVGISNWMSDKVEAFKSSFRKRELRVVRSAETAEELENVAQVARLKAAI